MTGLRSPDSHRARGSPLRLVHPEEVRSSDARRGPVDRRFWLVDSDGCSTTTSVAADVGPDPPEKCGRWRAQQWDASRWDGLPDGDASDVEGSVVESVSRSKRCFTGTRCRPPPPSSAHGSSDIAGRLGTKLQKGTGYTSALLPSGAVQTQHIVGIEDRLPTDSGYRAATSRSYPLASRAESGAKRRRPPRSSTAGASGCSATTTRDAMRWDACRHAGACISPDDPIRHACTRCQNPE